jgi:hypothetical protein
VVEEGPAGLSGVVAPVDSHAAGTSFDAGAAHDGRIVADLVAEWAGTHREPFTLALSGPAGGLFAAGTGGAQVELDAIEFCRILAERVHGEASFAIPYHSETV